jgi:cobalt/nickel transport system permease protein
MANELLSVPVAGGTLAVAAAGLGLACKKAKKIVTPDKIALMGILGAFIFAAQMVNFQLPAMPGTSGHLVGVVLLAVILGPHLAVVVMASVVIVQCLIFQDGGLLALGCNIINIALLPSYLGYFLYRIITAGQLNTLRAYTGALLACIISIEAGAICVPIQTALSGVLVVPFSTFLITMVGVHLLVGIVEGLVTIAVLGYLQQTRPDIIADFLQGKVRISRKMLLATLIILTAITAGGLSLLASELPDGLEWSYAERPDQPAFKPIIHNNNPAVAATDNLQSRYSLMPDYSLRGSKLGNANKVEADTRAGWTSFAGIVGSFLTMVLIWLVASLLRSKHTTIR